MEHDDGSPMATAKSTTDSSAASSASTAPQRALTAGPAAPAASTAQTNVFAILSLILALVGFSIPGIVLGHLALSQIKRTGEGGHSLAFAAVVIGYIAVGVVVVVGIIWLLLAFGLLAVLGIAASHPATYNYR